MTRDITKDAAKETARSRSDAHRARPDSFRRAIARAEAEGASRSDMVLHLTLSDTADLKRDRSIPLEDIRFVDGVMSFMGVKVTTGGVTTSALQTGDLDEPAGG